MRTVRTFFCRRAHWLLTGAGIFSAAALVLCGNSPVWAYPPATPVPSYYGEDFPTLNGAPALDFQFSGDQTLQLPFPPPSDPGTDPYANSSDISGGNPSDASSGVAYDSVHDITSLSYSGDPLSTGSSTIHVGFQVNDRTGLTPSSTFYANGTGSPLQQLPSFVGLPSTPIFLPTQAKYEIVYVTGTSAGQAVNAWLEVPYTQNPTMQLKVGGSDVTLSNVGFQLSPTLIPLDNLNFNDYPPPGAPGSNFASLPQYDGSMINAGGSATLVLPEPGSFALVAIAGTCAALAAGYRRWRRAS